MADEAKATLAKLAKLQTALLEVQDRQRAIVDEMGALLAGGPGIGAILKRLYAHFDECWRARYGPAPYVWAMPKDAQGMKRLLKTLDVQEIENRILTYLEDGDDFYTHARHAFPLFVASINKHAAPPARSSLCPHNPRCPTLTDCTARTVADGRLARQLELEG